MRRSFFFDTLNKTLLIAARILFLLRMPMTYVFAGVCLALAIMRTFSGDRSARQRENDMFRNFFARQKAKANAKKATNVRRIRPVYEGKAGESTMGKEKGSKEKKAKVKSDATHRVYKCPKCKQTLRVPRGKGKILITCSNCGHKFQKKT